MSNCIESRATAEALLLQQPLPLGVSLPPNNEHALSVSMPLWDHVVGYEEGRADVLDAMACGYPRFFRHPLVTELEEQLKKRLSKSSTLNVMEKEWHLMVMPTHVTAQRLQSFLTTQSDTKSTDKVAIHTFLSGSLYAVTFPCTLKTLANRFWQHTGEIVSSRHAQWALQQLTTNTEDQLQWDGTSSHIALCTRIAALYQTETARVELHHVFLYPTGMASIFAALRLALLRNPHGKAILFGFPYIDTLKLLERTQWCPHGVHFFPEGSENDLKQVETLLETETISAIFTEFPGNPLLSLPDLERLAQLAHARETLLIVDDTIGSYNINPFNAQASADVVVTSLAKIFSGTCTAMAGSVVVNPTSAAFTTFHEHLVSTNDSFLYEEDAATLLAASADLQPRLAQVNASASILVERLDGHPLVKALYYPSKQQEVERFHRLMTSPPSQAPRHGPLLSIVLHGGETTARAFYDHLKVAKGPSLGTNFTLVCPYTLLAHYHELDYVETCGVDRHLLRISVGLEDVEAIWQAIENAFSQVHFEKKKE